ncbi:unnamed protein product [Ixodes pacificus]
MLVHRAARNAALLPVTGMDDLPGTGAALAVEEACWSRLFMLRLQRTDSLSLSAVARTSCITRGCSSCRWKSTCRATPTWLFHILWSSVPFSSIFSACLSSDCLASAMKASSSCTTSTPLRSTPSRSWSAHHREEECTSSLN